MPKPLQVGCLHSTALTIKIVANHITGRHELYRGGFVDSWVLLLWILSIHWCILYAAHNLPEEMGGFDGLSWEGISFFLLLSVSWWKCLSSTINFILNDICNMQHKSNKARAFKGKQGTIGGVDLMIVNMFKYLIVPMVSSLPTSLIE